MIGIDGKPLQGGELLLLGLIFAALLAIIFYIYVIAPQRMQEKAKRIALTELAQEASETERRARQTPAQRKFEDDEKERSRREVLAAKELQNNLEADKRAKMFYGEIVPTLVCPHCQTKGSVRRTERTRVDKARVNSVAGRAIGLGTNTERQVTQLHCDNCSMQWDV